MLEPSWMVVTRFATKMWNLVVLFAMYLRTEVLSVQKWASNSNSIAEVIKVTNFTERLVAVSPILGIVTFLRGRP